jgi:hypothetical protein
VAPSNSRAYNATWFQKNPSFHPYVLGQFTRVWSNPKRNPLRLRALESTQTLLTTGAPLREVRRIGIRVWGGDLLTDTAGLPGRTGELQTLIYRAKSRLFKVTQGLMCRVEEGRWPGPTGSRWFPFPAHQTGRAQLEHPAFRQTSPTSSRKWPQVHVAKPQYTPCPEHNRVRETGIAP